MIPTALTALVSVVFSKGLLCAVHAGIPSHFGSALQLGGGGGVHTAYILSPTAKLLLHFVSQGIIALVSHDVLLVNLMVLSALFRRPKLGASGAGIFDLFLFGGNDGFS